MNRRRFLGQSGAVAASSVLGLDLLAQPARAAGCGGPPSGVQLFTVNDELARDPAATLRALREIGIVEAELFGLSGPESTTLFGHAARDLKRAFDVAGVSVPISHIDGALTNTAAISEIARTLGVSTVVVARPNEFPRGKVALQSRAELGMLAEKLNRVGREYRDKGLVFGYHNHSEEFVPVDGVVPYDYLMDNTDPGLVKIELDLGWLAVAGADPVAYLRRYAGRVIACHLKDYDSAIVTDTPERKLVAPGAGSVDFAAVLAAMNETNVQHGFIEIDVSDDPFGDVRRGHTHLQRLKGCA